MILEPLKKIKEADLRLNLTGGVLEGVGMCSSFCKMFHDNESRVYGHWLPNSFMILPVTFRLNYHLI